MTDRAIIDRLKNEIEQCERIDLPDITLSKKIEASVNALRGIPNDELAALRDIAERIGVELLSFEDKDAGTNFRNIIEELKECITRMEKDAT